MFPQSVLIPGVFVSGHVRLGQTQYLHCGSVVTGERSTLSHPQQSSSIGSSHREVSSQQQSTLKIQQSNRNMSHKKKERKKVNKEEVKEAE